MGGVEGRGGEGILICWGWKLSMLAWRGGVLGMGWDDGFFFLFFFNFLVFLYIWFFIL